MKKGLQILILLFFSSLSAQIKTVQSVYFDFDKFILNENQIAPIIKLVKSSDFSQMDAIQLYGYCDDRGSLGYNDELSKNRVEFVQKILISSGVSPEKIFVCEGRGKVILDQDTIKNLEITRDKNRRVDLIFVKKTTYTSFPENPKVGDNIILGQIHFEMGSSELTLLARKELDKTILQLKKHNTLSFEIRGHVCCTSDKHNDAIDKENQIRNLSESRAKNVFLYFRSKGISPYRMSFKGYGNQFPLGKGDEQDRRVELYITKL